MNVKADLESSGASDVVKTAMKYFNGSDTIVAPVFKLAADIEQVENDATIALLQGSITPEEWMDRMEKAAAKIGSKFMTLLSKQSEDIRASDCSFKFKGRMAYAHEEQ